MSFTITPTIYELQRPEGRFAAAVADIEDSEGGYLILSTRPTSDINFTTIPPKSLVIDPSWANWLQPSVGKRLIPWPGSRLI